MLISFATGTSMGTMAIMAVISLPMAYDMGVSIPLVAGAMFGGSIFGDHCSPISDTTIMTCSTTGCDIIDHVKTQMPYCIAMAVASFILYAVLGFIISVHHPIARAAFRSARFFCLHPAVGDV